MGNLQEYWDIMRSSKNMQGGCIWEWYNHCYPAYDEQGRFYWAYGGDLKGYYKKNDGNFIADGLISPDQNYLPHTYIVRKVYQNILFKSKDLAQGIITLNNDYRFIDLTPDNHTYKWLLLKNGEKCAEGAFEATVPAMGAKDVKLALPQITPQAGTEYFLQVFAYTKQSTELLPAGFEIAKEEFAMPDNNYFASIATSSGADTTKITTERNDDRLVVQVGKIKYEFALRNRSQALYNLVRDNERIFSEHPRLNFWRAPTDNDFGAKDQIRLRLWEVAGHNLRYNFKGIDEAADSIRIRYTVKPQGIECEVDVNYTVRAKGLTISATYRALSDDLPEMMRFGMIMTLPREYDDFTWYGRGPRENYIDRCADNFMGVWNGKVSEQAYPYIRPQETGNKTGVRWLTLKQANGKTVRISGLQPLSVSATNNRPEDLDPGITKKQQHASDVLPLPNTILCVDLFQRGVAGLNTWGAQPLPPYRFFGKTYSYAFTVEL